LSPSGPIPEDWHVWVCDGFKNFYFCQSGEISVAFSMNWGWGGAANGYYSDSDLTPRTFDFTVDNHIIHNITP